MPSVAVKCGLQLSIYHLPPFLSSIPKNISKEQATIAGRNMGVFGPMAASMKEARLEGPVLGEVRPGVGSRGSSGCAPVEESPEQKALLGPLLVRSHSVRGMRDALCLSVTLPLRYSWESHDPHRVRVSITNRQTLWCPELE